MSRDIIRGSGDIIRWKIPLKNTTDYVAGHNPGLSGSSYIDFYVRRHNLVVRRNPVGYIDIVCG
jgi:hypothetical protein